jgi:hypothetical protein
MHSCNCVVRDIICKDRDVNWVFKGKWKDEITSTALSKTEKNQEGTADGRSVRKIVFLEASLKGIECFY